MPHFFLSYTIIDANEEIILGIIIIFLADEAPGEVIRAADVADVGAGLAAQAAAGVAAAQRARTRRVARGPPARLAAAPRARAVLTAPAARFLISQIDTHLSH